VVNPILSAQAASLRRRQLRLEADRARNRGFPAPRAPSPVPGAVAGLLRALADRIDPNPARRAEPPVRLVRS
jgi:hypothetical protein